MADTADEDMSGVFGIHGNGAYPSGKRKLLIWLGDGLPLVTAVRGEIDSPVPRVIVTTQVCLTGCGVQDGVLTFPADGQCAHTDYREQTPVIPERLPMPR